MYSQRFRELLLPKYRYDIIIYEWWKMSSTNRNLLFARIIHHPPEASIYFR